ncbi:MAG: hypothetical protein QM765_14830 [Myxococcales bacterium]
MVDFGAKLGAALSGVNASFQQADKDLHEIVVEASAAVEKNSMGLAKVELEPKTEDLKGTCYALQLVTKVEEKYRMAVLGGYFVESRGYPIIYGELEQKVQGTRLVYLVPEAQGLLNSKEDLIDHFMKLLTSAESPVVMHVAFLVRQKEKADAVPF